MIEFSCVEKENDSSDSKFEIWLYKVKRSIKSKKVAYKKSYPLKDFVNHSLCIPRAYNSVDFENSKSLRKYGIVVQRKNSIQGQTAPLAKESIYQTFYPHHLRIKINKIL